MGLESGAGTTGCWVMAKRPRPRPTRPGMTLEQLDVWLGELDPPGRVGGTSMLDGYLTALIIGPCSIPPEEWFGDLFGARGDIAVARGTMLTAIEAIIARFNAISQTLSTAPERHAPILEKTADGFAHPHPWCLGFVAAMRLRLDAWQPLLNADPSNALLMLPILLYCADIAGAPLPDLAQAPIKLEDLLRSAYQDIPRAIIAIREYWMPKRRT
jgi:uncharacterized protein